MDFSDVRNPLHQQAVQLRRRLLRTEANTAHATSPALQVSLHNNVATATIDEGAELKDFSALNKFIINPQGISPTIQEAKDFLARAKYVINLDLSNWFYQSGMDRQYIQFLGTVHPYKGVLVYSCESQGLRGSPEHSYEKLTRIYGDLLRDDKFTRRSSTEQGFVVSHLSRGRLKSARSRPCFLVGSWRKESGH